MLSKQSSLIFLSSMLLALPLAGRAQSQTQLVDKYSTFAGSDANAKSLVTGLREGKEVKLTDGKTTTSFTPPTGKLGEGNVNIALALAQESLKEKGITNPTPDQLKSALSGILQQRADGKGWGEIANSMGFKLGDVMRSDKADKVAKDRDARERTARAERPEKPARPEKPERPERPERGGR
jgi:hypothetical protein